MTNFFNGKTVAEENEKVLKERVEKLSELAIFPKIVSLIIGDDQKSNFYQNLKKRAAERIGIELGIINLDGKVFKEEVINIIENLNTDKKIHGIMIQLPFPDKFSVHDRNEMINSINLRKDVDGLREDSMYIAPVVKAVIYAIPNKNTSLKTVILGARGFEGRKITKKLRELGYRDVFELDRTGNKDLKKIFQNADLIISATGQPDLIRPDMIKEGVILIDVGSPYGDISRSCYEKASYVSPVPGGIGPVTISYLLENVVDACEDN